MRNFISLLLALCAPVVILNFPSVAFAQKTTCNELAQKFLPQKTPEATYRLELKLMLQGLYCYNLPIFDPQWRKKSSVLKASDRYKKTAKMFDKAFKTHIEGKYAIIYYPENKQLGPVFLYKDKTGWVLDRTSVINNIHYGDAWMADEGSYPYLKLLKKVFNLNKGRSTRGKTVYHP